MRNSSRRSLYLPCVLLWTGLLAVALSGCQRTDHYPSRPLILVCPWAAGGGTDRISRHIAALLEQELGVPVNVINATGGGGVTGHTRGALASADGYTLTMITPELNILNQRGLTNLSYRDFQPLMLVNRDGAALFVREDSPWKTLNELTVEIRNSTQPLKASGTARLAIWHLSLAAWLDAEGLDPNRVTWISSSGSNPSLQELLSGGIDMVCCSIPEAQSLLDAKKIRCLGLMAEQRLPGMPDILTFKEQGVNWSHRGWRGLGVPRGVPQDRVQVLAKAIQKVVTSEAYLKYMREANFGAAAVGGEEFVQFLAEDDRQYADLLKSEAFASVQSQSVGPMFFPAVLIVFLVATLILIWWDGGFRLKLSSEGITRKGLWYIFLAIGWVLLFALALDVAGFVISGVVLLTALLLLLRVRWFVALLVPLVLVPVLWQLFAVTLRVPLPWGWLGW